MLVRAFPSLQAIADLFAFAIDPIDSQDTFADEHSPLLRRAVFLRDQLQWHFEKECRADADLAGDADGASHQFNQLFADRQTQAGASEFA